MIVSWEKKMRAKEDDKKLKCSEDEPTNHIIRVAVAVCVSQILSGTISHERGCFSRLMLGSLETVDIVALLSCEMKNDI